MFNIYNHIYVNYKYNHFSYSNIVTIYYQKVCLACFLTFLNGLCSRNMGEKCFSKETHSFIFIYNFSNQIFIILIFYISRRSTSQVNNI